MAPTRSSTSPGDKLKNLTQTVHLLNYSSSSDCAASNNRTVMKNKYDRTWKESVMVYNHKSLQEFACRDILKVWKTLPHTCNTSSFKQQLIRGRMQQSYCIFCPHGTAKTAYPKEKGTFFSNLFLHRPLWYRHVDTLSFQQNRKCCIL